jgi:hypothetical protein
LAVNGMTTGPDDLRQYARCMYLYAYIAIALLVESVFAYSVQPGERLTGSVETVLISVLWPLWLAWCLLTITFEFWVRSR